MNADPPLPGAPSSAAGQVGGPPLRVAAPGMDARQIRALELMFEGPCHDTCVLVDEPLAEACILDLDGYQARTALKELRERSPDLPLILLSVEPVEPDLLGRDLFAAKPIRIQELVAHLATLHALMRQPAVAAEPESAAQSAREAEAQAAREAEDLAAREAELELALETDPATESEPVPRRASGWGRPASSVDAQARDRAARLLDDEQAHALVGTAPDVDPRDPEQLAKAYYDPSRFLQSLVTAARDSAKARGRAVRIAGPWPDIVLDPTRSLAYVADSDSRLRPYCVQPALTHLGTLDYIQPLKLERGQPGTIELDSLVWKLALWASRGRLPLDTPVDIPIVLHRWPNFPRLLLAPGAMSIAALWHHEPHTLLRTAELLSLPQRSVFSFYSAAAALGLAECASEGSVYSVAAQRSAANAPQPHRKRGLLERIVRRLRIHS